MDCTCEKCRRMCALRPCWPTPDEAKAIEEAGYGDRMAETAIFHGDEMHTVRCPAPRGKAGTFALEQTGPCTFFRNGRCELHRKGLKPKEGRLAHHTMTREQSIELRLEVGQEWVR
jgi:hypothetical protein